MFEDFCKKIKGRCRIRPLDRLAKGIERWIPLEGLFVKEGNSVDCESLGIRICGIFQKETYCSGARKVRTAV
jgi:hypothetical protein